MSDKRLEELELAAFMQDINRAAVNNGIENFCDAIAEILPSGFSIEPIRSLMEGNGELSWILDKAEEVSRGNDGAALELGSHLKSVAASVSLFEKSGLDADLPLSVRDGNSCIPGSADTSSLKELFSEMLDDMKELIVNKNFSSFFFALDSLFEHYLSTVPSVSSCVSLYQKAKIKVAIASSLYLYAADDGGKDVGTEGRPFVLLSGDATGIQKYIFGVNTYKHSVKMIRARSFQIWIQSLLIAGHICSSLGLTNSNIITFSGGKFLLLLPNTDALKNVISNTRYEVDNLCLSEYSGEIAYIISDGVKCTQNELEADNNLNIQKRIRIDTANSKQKKLQEGINSRSEGAVFSRQYERLGTSGNVCTACDSNPASDGSDFCSGCAYLIELGRVLNKREYNIYLNFNIISALNNTVRIRKTSEPNSNWQGFSISRYVPGMARISMPYYVPVDEKSEEVKTFEELAMLSSGVKRLAMFKADVDYLGLIFSSSLKERWSLSRYASLSSSFHFYFSESLVQRITLDYPDLYVVFSGGDDVCIIGPWDKVLEFSDSFNSDFHKFTSDNPSLSVSAGIVLFNPHDPISAVSEEAEEALEASKNMEDKNSITIFSRTVSWREFAEQLKNAEVLATMPQESKSGLLYKLLSYSDNAKDMKEEKINIENMKKALWLSHYSYMLRRHTVKNDVCAKLLRSYKNCEKMINAKIAASIALYSNRGGE